MKSSLALELSCIAALASFAHAQQVLGTLAGQLPGDRFGASAITIADQNGDGVPDLAVGAPGHNGGNGAVYCVSGQSLSSSSGVIVIWVIVPVTAPQPSAFGTSLALVGNLVGDSKPDFVIGAPNFFSGGHTTGALYLIDGATATTASVVTGYPDCAAGRALAAVGDQNGDGLPDLITTSSPTTNSNLRLTFLPGNKLIQGGSLSVLAPSAWQWGAYQTGENLATGFDHDHDGRPDIAVGAPLNSIFHVMRADGTWTFLGLYYSGDDSEHAATSISAAEDYDGDGAVDFLVGAPNWNAGAGTEHGRVIVVSGASILTPHYPPTVITSLTVPSTNPTPVDMHFGARVLAGPDLTGDGVGEIVVGAPDYHTTIPFGPNKGAVSVFSGATLTRIGSNVGANNDHLGDTLVAAFHDLNGDGALEFAVAGSLSDTGGTDSGVLKCLSLFPGAPSTYCTAKTNSLGCVPGISWNGIASASSASPFLVTCANVINQKVGLLMYSHQPIATPFQGGYLCVNTPLVRTLPQNSGGSVAGADCTGTFSFDFNARIHSAVDPLLIVGAEVFAQHWSRDPASASHTNLSNALHFLINP